MHACPGSGEGTQEGQTALDRARDMVEHGRTYGYPEIVAALEQAAGAGVARR